MCKKKNSAYRVPQTLTSLFPEVEQQQWKQPKRLPSTGTTKAIPAAAKIARTHAGREANAVKSMQNVATQQHKETCPGPLLPGAGRRVL